MDNLIKLACVIVTPFYIFTGHAVKQPEAPVVNCSESTVSVFQSALPPTMITPSSALQSSLFKTQKALSATSIIYIAKVCASNLGVHISNLISSAILATDILGSMVVRPPVHLTSGFETPQKQSITNLLKIEHRFLMTVDLGHLP